MSTQKATSLRSVAALARKHCGKAIEVLAKAMDSGDERVAIDAASKIMDRGIGKPIAMTADVTDRLDEFSDEQLEAAIADLKHRLAIAEGATGEARAEQGPQSAEGVQTVQ